MNHNIRATWLNTVYANVERPHNHTCSTIHPVYPVIPYHSTRLYYPLLSPTILTPLPPDSPTSH